MNVSRILRTLLIASSLGCSVSALATVDAYLNYSVVYREIQTDDYCYRQLPMWAEVGIPAASQMLASQSPTQIFKQNSMGTSYIDINEVSKVGGLKTEYLNDAYDARTGVYTYAMKVSLSEMSADRSTLVQTAKFALLAMNRNLSLIYPGKYKLWVSFEGLPSQSGLAGTTLNASTQYPYTAGSPLIKAYEKELINVSGTCPR